MMKRDWFDVGVRLIGVWQIADGLDELVTYVNVVEKMYTPAATSANGFLTHAFAHLLIGLVLFLSAANIVNAVYKPEVVVGPEDAA